MRQLDIVTQQNASNSEEAATIAADLSNQGQVLSAQVDKLVETVKG